MAVSTLATLEPLQEEHFALAADWINDPDINRWLYAEWRERPAGERLVAIATMNKKNRIFLIRSNEHPVGLAAISQINTLDRHCAIWYLLGETGFGGKGVVTAAVRMLVEHALEQLTMHTIEASVIASNQGSIKVLEHNGFTLAGKLRESFVVEGNYHDRLVYELVAT